MGTHMGRTTKRPLWTYVWLLAFPVYVAFHGRRAWAEFEWDMYIEGYWLR